MDVFWNHTLLFKKLCGSRKYPYPKYGGNWKFQRGGGGGGSKAQKIPEGWGGVDSQINFQMVQFDSVRFSTDLQLLLLENWYLPTLVERSEVRKGFASSARGRP